MDKVIRFPGRHRCVEEASVWIVRIDAGLSADDARELDEWLAASPDNAFALLEMGRLWDELEAVEELRMLLPAKQIQQAGHRWSKAIPIALAICGLAFAGWWPRVDWSPSDEPARVSHERRIYQTDIGSRATERLPDGTTVELNTNTRMEVRYTASDRVIALDRGEATFKVAHDPSRPFYVFAGGRVVQALGTVFNVQLGPNNEVEVAVTEGRVQLLRRDTPIAVPASVQETESRAAEVLPESVIRAAEPESVIRAGEMLVVDDSASTIKELLPEDIDITLAWQRGMLIFRGEPLAVVLEEVSRYTPVTFEVSDPQLSSINVGGYFPAGDVDRLIMDLQETFHVRVDRRGDHIVLRAN